jgi:hypothetical protein
VTDDLKTPFDDNNAGFSFHATRHVNLMPAATAIGIVRAHKLGRETLFVNSGFIELLNLD